MTIINLTPHIINIKGHGDATVAIKPEAIPARCVQKNVFVGHVEYQGEKFPVFRSEFGKVENLPEPKEGVKYVVSKVVADAVLGTRDDILIPGPAIRDDKGRTIGADGFCIL